MGSMLVLCAEKSKIDPRLDLTITLFVAVSALGTQY
jgi:hypothetical protein